MNLIDAIKRGKPFRRPGWTIEAYMADDGRLHRPDECKHSISIARYEYLADDWEIQEPTVTITRTQFMQAFCEAFGLTYQAEPFAVLNYLGVAPPLAQIHLMAMKLGLEP